MAKSYTVDEFKDAFTDNLSQYFVSNIRWQLVNDYLHVRYFEIDEDVHIRWRVKDDQVVVASYKRLS